MYICSYKYVFEVLLVAHTSSAKQIPNKKLKWKPRNSNLNFKSVSMPLSRFTPAYLNLIEKSCKSFL